MATVLTFDMNRQVSVTTSAIAAHVAADALTTAASEARDRLERNLMHAVARKLQAAADTATETVDTEDLI